MSILPFHNVSKKTFWCYTLIDLSNKHLFNHYLGSAIIFIDLISNVLKQYGLPEDGPAYHQLTEHRHIHFY